MSEHARQEYRLGRSTEPTCRLMPLAEALQAGEQPPVDCIGVVACGRCLGVFDVQSEPGGKIAVESPGHISCDEGFVNHDGHHLET